MDGILLAARLILAAAFFVAAVVKLFERDGAIEVVELFGAPQATAPALGRLLPLLELAIAVALVPAPSAWIASIAAFVVLGAYSVAIAVALWRGRQLSCTCFGQISAAPVDLSTLARSGVLAAIGLFVAIGAYASGGTHLNDWISGLSTSDQVRLGVALAALALLLSQWKYIYNLLQLNGGILQRVEALEQGVIPAGGVAQELGHGPNFETSLRIPSLSLPDLEGNIVTTDDLLAHGKPILQIFVSPDVDWCKALIPDIATWQRGYSDTLTTVVISRGTMDDTRAMFANSGVRTVLTLDPEAFHETFGVSEFPAAAVIDDEGDQITSALIGVEDVRALAASAISAAAPLPRRVSLGDSVPAITLQRLGGEMVDLSRATMGQKTVLLFWSTRCGFCDRMLPDLKRWERRKRRDGPEVILISNGPVAENRAMGLKSPILLDPMLTAGEIFGAEGTPMGVLVDESGKITSDVVVGADDVFALAR